MGLTIKDGLVDAEFQYGAKWSEGDRRALSKGRNGSFFTTALTLRGMLPTDGQGSLILAPANSRNQVTGACMIEIPADPEWLRAFAASLLRVAEEIERGGGT